MSDRSLRRIANSSQPSTSMYSVGQQLLLRIERTQEPSLFSNIQVHVLRLHDDGVTVKLEVEIQPLDQRELFLPGNVFLLKLFDRRFAHKLRSSKRLRLWNKNKEIDLIHAFHDESLHTDEDFSKSYRKKRSHVDRELFLANEMQELYKKENRILELLEEHQGNIIPKLYARTELHSLKSIDTSKIDSVDPFLVKGFLFENVQGVKLSKITKNIVPAAWQTIYNDVFHAIQAMDEKNVLIEADIFESFTVCGTWDGNRDMKEKVYMTDFTSCRLRERRETDLEWVDAKNEADVEGKVSRNLKQLMHRLELHPTFKLNSGFEVSEAPYDSIPRNTTDVTSLTPQLMDDVTSITSTEIVKEIIESIVDSAMISWDFDKPICTSEYNVGQKLILNVEESDNIPNQRTLGVRILRLDGNSCSCTMLVEIIDKKLHHITSAFAYLKLFDRRFAVAIREYLDFNDWAPEIEKELICSCAKKPALYFHDTIEEAKETDELLRECPFKTANQESIIMLEAHELYENEISVYNTLRKHQGERIPKLYGNIELRLHTASEFDSRTEKFHPFLIKGILLQYLDGCPLNKVVDYFPRSSWNGIFGDALNIVRLLDEYNILNEDVAGRNFIVCKDHDSDTCSELKMEFSKKAHVYMIDFGLCRFREINETNEKWVEDKLITDEEDAIGITMQAIFASRNYELIYEKTQYLRYRGIYYS